MSLAPDNGNRLQRLAAISARQRDEAAACAQFAAAESAAQQEQERQADLTAARIIGSQCRVGEGAAIRHQLLMLGMNWYLTAEMGDKLLDMGVVSKSALIRSHLTNELGASLYQRTMAARQARAMPGGGAVAVAYPPSHPPDAERMRSIEEALQQSPCGGSGLDNGTAKLLDAWRAQMCRGLATNAAPR
jgi:Zn-dependent protease with chaperone function